MNIVARSVIGMCVVATLLTGCGGKGAKNDAASAASNPPKQGLGPKTEFESSKDAPLTADTHFAAGQLAESEGDTARAITQYAAALKITPSHQPSLFRLASAYTQQKRFPEAIDTWEKYVKATGGSASAYNNLAFCNELAGRAGEAERAYREGIVKDPDDGPCRVNYGLMLARAGRFDDATAQLRVVLTPAEVQYDLGSAAEQVKKTDDAARFYKKALELDPRFHEAKARLDALGAK